MFEQPKDVDRYLKKVISTFEGSTEKEMMQTGEKYYLSENTKIMARRKYMYARDDNGTDYLIEDPYKANNKLASGYAKILVDQKVRYSLGKAITITASEESSEEQKNILDLLGKDFPKTLKKTGKSASKKYIGWAQVYIDQAGNFRTMHIPSEQVVPIYKDAEELEYVIRYYPVTVIIDDEAVEVNRAEVWDEKNVTYFQQDKDKNYKLYSFPDGSANPRPHLRQVLRYGEKKAAENGLSWDRVPFIPFYNNDEKVYDLQAVKRHIDVYDVIESDFANNLEDIQDVYWILKGYNGENIDTFLAEVKKYKTLKVSDEGDAHAESIDIPHEARRIMLGILNDDIYKFGRGVDPNKSGDGNITNVVIKARFANLDLKASEFESQCTDFIDSIMYFLNRYLEIKKEQPITDYTITFNRSQIFNETELLASNIAQQGAISEDTRLANHPWVDDVQAEKEKMENEKPEITIDAEVDTDDSGDSENEER